MERRFQTGTVVSAVGHIGVVLWALVGDWLFTAEKPPETITMTATTISERRVCRVAGGDGDPVGGARAGEAAGTAGGGGGA